MKKVIAIMLVLATLFPLIACNDNAAEYDITNLSYFTASSNEKIMADKTYENSVTESKVLSFKGGKGEYESAQVIAVSKTKVSNLDFTVSNLVSGANEIKAENITVYFEKYINIESMSSPSFRGELGYYPDALVPFYAIKNKGENVLEQNTNQGFWITVYIPADAKAGVYTGSFELIAEGKSLSVPVSLTVWDFVVPQETHMQTVFSFFREHLMNGELDNSEKMVKEYYDFLMDYRISLDRLPLFENDVDEFIKLAKEYSSNPLCASYGINLFFEMKNVQLLDGETKFIDETDWDTLKAYILALAHNSTPELNLLEKAVIYDWSIDEPEGTNRVKEAKYKAEKIKEVYADVVSELTADPDFNFAAHGVTGDDVWKIDYIATNRYTSELNNFMTYCPDMGWFKTASDFNVYRNMVSESEYNTFWWYVAWQPQYPYANFRIEESSLGLRVLNWMQMDYGVSGFLYWATSVYAGIEDNGFGNVRDAYEDPYSFLPQRVTCDGQITYPGRPYDIYGPLPSIRLMAMRDGLEDYEYLWYLKELIAEANTKYAYNFNYESIMRTLYDSLYSVVIPNYNNEQFDSARDEVASLIELLNSDANAMVLTENIDVNTNVATLKIFAGADVTVKVDGNAPATAENSGSGKVYTYAKSMDKAVNYAEITFEVNGKTVTFVKYLGQKMTPMPMYSDGATKVTASKGNVLNPQDHITLSNDAGSSGFGAAALKAVISEYTAGTPTQNSAYSPYLEFNKADFFAGINTAKLDTVYLNIYGTGSRFIGKKVFIQLVASNGETIKASSDFTMQSGVNTISAKQIYLTGWSKLSDIKSIRVVFEKSAPSQAVTYYLGNMFYTEIG